MRKFLTFALISIVATGGAYAWEPTAATDVLQEVVLTQSPQVETVVTIEPVPLPAKVIEVASYTPKRISQKQAKKAKTAKVAARAKSMLSRSAREQIALANSRTKPDDQARIDAADHGSDEAGFDDLDFHRSFSQPKVAKTPDEASDDPHSNLSNYIKLRLLLARTKAVEAHALSQAVAASDGGEERLSDAVKLRLHIARARAVKAHVEKFGQA